MDIDALVSQVAAAAPMPAVDNPAPCSWLTAGIDGDYMAYFAAGSDNTAPGLARLSVLKRVDKVRRLTGAEKVIMHLTAGNSTKGDRFLVAETQKYQGQRAGSKKPRNWGFLRDFMEGHDGSRFTPKLWYTREADDGMAYVMHALAEHKKQLHVVHTADKDMRMFAGLHLNWKTWHKTVVPLGAYDVQGADGLQYGHKWFWIQMLTGDTADFIPGLHNVGKVTAEAALAGTQSNADAYRAVEDMYRRKLGPGWERFMVEQAVLLWMRVDRHASLLDFLRLGVFPHSVLEAAWHMVDRVQEQKDYLENLYK